MKRVAAILWYGLIFVQKAIMVIGASVIAILIFIEVFLRYVLASPLFGIGELILFIAMWLYFLGAAYGSYERTHIQAELLHLWIKNKRLYAGTKAMTSILTTFLSIVMVTWSYPYFLWGLTRGAKSQALLWPMVISQSAVFFGAILMSIYFTAELVDYVLQALGREPFFASLHEKETSTV